MDKSPVARRLLSTAAVALVAAALVACAAHAARKPLDGLKEAFQTVGRVPLYLDFPFRPDMVASCEAHHDKSCLRVYRNVRNAVARIFSDGREAALQHTLTALVRECPLVIKKPPPPLEDTCRGAALALYFFRSDREDQLIVDRLASADSDVLRGLFTREASHQWAGDRPVPGRWRALIHRASLTREQNEELTKVFAGNYPHPSHVVDGQRWAYPLIHIVDPQYAQERERGTGPKK